MMTVLLLLAPILLALASFAMARLPARRGHWTLRIPEVAALCAIALGLGAAVDLVLHGPATGPLVGLASIGLSVRIDIVSVAMTLTVALVGWVVLRFSRVALDGEVRQFAFMGWMSVTVAVVLLLVQSGNVVQLALAWAATGATIHQLLLFYPDRPRARRAARKKAVSGIISTGALLIGAGALVLVYGTSDIAEINATARGGLGVGPLWLVPLCLAVAAIFKSALVPTHGWLTEVMEAPTPVSALLHAGIVNAGGFLLIRFADVMVAAPGVLAVLALIGGFSALVGAAVALTQPAVKTGLAWSTCAQMGFMVLQCGLALFPLALLHIVAHSLYKAHAFLSSGSAVAEVVSIRRPGPVARPGLAAVGRSFALSLALYVVVGLPFGILSEAPQAVALGAILIFGVAYLMAQGLADLAPRALAGRTALLSVLATIGYFSFQHAATWAAGTTLPAPPAPDGLAWATIVLALASFGLAALAQATFPLWADHPAAAGLRVHLMNGLYINAITDRLAGRWATKTGDVQ